MPERKYTYKVEIDAAQAKAQATALRQQLTADLAAIEQRKANTAAAADVRRRAAAEEKAILSTIAQAKRQVAQQEAAQKKLTAITEREARKRVLAEEKATVAAAKAAERSARQQEVEQRRITAATERETRRRALAQRAPVLARGAATAGAAWNGINMASGLLAGGLAAYGVAQLGQQAIDAGSQGAQLMRQQATFNEFSARMGQNAAAIIAAVRSASRETITEFDAMSLASQVLASKFAENSTDIAGDLSTVTAASRRFSQIFVDKESGAAMSTQEIFSRMIGYAREGNKELVDQFGLSNQIIAEAMGVTVEAFSGTDGAALRWQGLIKVLNQEMKRLGEAAITTADRYEQSAARMADAQQRIQMAMAQPMAGFGEVGAGLAEGALTLFSAAPIDLLEKQMFSRSQLPGADAKSFEAGATALKAYNTAMQENAAVASMFSGNLQSILSDLQNQGRLSDELVRSLNGMAASLDLVTRGGDAYSVTMRTASMEQIKASAALLEYARDMAELEQLYISGQLTQSEYTARLYQMASGMSAVRSEIENTLPALREFTALSGGASGPTFVDAVNPWIGPDNSGLTPAEVSRIERMKSAEEYNKTFRERQEAATLANEPYTAAGQDKLRQQLVLDMQKQAAEDERAAAKAAQSEWESAAKKTAAEFEAAAEKAAAAFESALRAVPGLFGTSDVTADQMAGAAAGVPQNFADNYLRRLADEVGGGKDWEGIDIQDAARRAGVDGGLPKDIILQQVRSAWEDSSLFAGGRNMDLITDFGGLDAIKANLARQEASASGQQSLIDYMSSIGLGPAAAKGEEGAPAGVTSPEQAPAAAADTVAAIKASFEAENVTKSLRAVGENTIAAIHGGYANGAGKLDWAGPLVDAVAAQVLASLNTALNKP
jgi:hypothetical protein